MTAVLIILLWYVLGWIGYLGNVKLDKEEVMLSDLPNGILWALFGPVMLFAFALIAFVTWAEENDRKLF